MAAHWMPGEPRPAYLDGSAPGDFGFDPLGLGEVPANLERYKSQSSSTVDGLCSLFLGFWYQKH
jgi:hypothetical protein